MTRSWIVRGVLIVVAALLLAILGSAAYVYHLGLRGVTDLVLARVAPVHRIASMTRLPDGRFEMRGVYLQAETWRLRADRLHGRIDVLPTFDLKSMSIGLVHLQTLSGDNVQVRATTRSTTPARVLKLPGVTIDLLRLTRADVRVDQVQVILTELSAQLHTRGSEVQLLQLDTYLHAAGQRMRIRKGALDFALTIPRRLRADLDWQRSSDSGAAAGHLRMQGPLDFLQGRLRVDAPLSTEAAVALRKTALGAAIVQLQLGSTVLQDLVGSIDLRSRPFPIRVRTRATVPALGVLDISALTRWTGEAMPIDAQVVAGKQTAAVTGELDPATWNAMLQLDGVNIDAAQWVAGADSKLRVHADITAHLLQPLKLDVALVADGQLLKYPVDASTAFTIDADGATLHSASLSQRNNRVRVWPEGTTLRADLQLRDLHTLSTQWRGQLVGTGTLAGQGALATRTMQFNASANQLAFGDRIRIAALHLQGRASLKRVDIQANGANLLLGPVKFDTLSAGLNGSAAAHQLNVELQMPMAGMAGAAQIQGRARGSWQRETWSGVLDALTLSSAKYGRWGLRSKAVASVRNGNARLGSLCLDGAAGRRAGAAVAPASGSVCVSNAQYSAVGATGEATMRNLPLALVALPLPDALPIEGRLDGEFKLDPAGINGKVRLQDTVARLRGKRIAIEVAQAQGRWPFATSGRGLAQVDAEISSSSFGTVNAHINRSSNGALSGNVDATLHDLGYVQALLINTRTFYIDGQAKLALSLSGTQSAPHLGGVGNVTGILRLPRLGLAPLPVRLNMTGNDSDAGFSGTVGRLNVQGKVGLASLTEPTVSAHITGNNVRLIEREDLIASITPDVRVSMTQNFANIVGRVRVETADLRFATGGGRRGGLSDDVVIHAAIDPRAQPPRVVVATTPAFNWAADLQLELGDAVQFAAAGLKARLTGQLRVQARPPEPLRVLGYVNAVDGSFDTYGVRLKVQRGRLDFNGPVDNPRVDARAIRNLNESGTDMVGVRISGPLQRMETQLFSEPPRTAEDSLALLVTGQSLAASSAADLQAVGEAGLALGVLDALPVTSVIRDTLGLDELEVRNPLSRDGSQIRIGKQITQRLRARYVYSVFNRTGGLQLRYQVTDRLSLQTEAGAETSAIDLLWEWQSMVPTADSKEN